TDGILSGKIRMNDVEKALSENPDSCLYVTSPDYTGRIADIKRLSEICHRYNAPLLVDNAHGAHLNFFPESIHPMALGADICCDSAHKMLPALTGSAVLHTSREKYAHVLRKCMGIFGSTSPSYLIMASLDLCVRYISENIRQDIENNLRFLRNFRERFSGRLVFSSGEPFHISIKADESGLDGNELADILRKNGVECEYSDCGTLILLMSPVNIKDDYEYLAQALEKSLNIAERHPRESCYFLPELPQKAMSIRQAVFSPCEDIPVEYSAGRICGAVSVPCPPAIPIVASGEIIDENSINIFRNYGIPFVNVVK
ncbi:MAG: aminotransferase class V-fold PLP-dependent enzyme, partial [Ruminococcus sp.]|nr:aminotransferase class V-fold PLP-dependent enzyme [Ruminococcus sp.]